MIVCRVSVMMILILLVGSSLGASPGIEIIAPNLKQPVNKISADNAEMPSLVINLSINDLNVPDTAKYRWWLRIVYKTPPLKISPRLGTFGCATNAPESHLGVWTLPVGDRKQACIHDMTKRKTSIITESGQLNLSEPIQIENPDGSRELIFLKNKEGDPTTQKGQLLYGGGKLEISVQLNFTDEHNKEQTYVAHFPSESSKDPYLVGINPNRKDTATYYKSVSDALYTNDPSAPQKITQQRVIGKHPFEVIPTNLYELLPNLFDVIACRETRRSHFCTDEFCIGAENIHGLPIVAEDGGYGMFQLTYPPPTYYEKWSWQENLLNTAARVYNHTPNAKKLAGRVPTEELKQRVIFRELFARHNASNISYFTETGSRRPIICREPVAFTHNAPNTDPIYRKNMKHNPALLQALEQFGFELRSTLGRNCPNGMGRKIEYHGHGKSTRIITVSSCDPGPHQLSRGDTKITTHKLPENFNGALNHFGGQLIDNRRASCSEHYNRNAARRVVGTYKSPDTYLIEAVGLCHNSPTCYVDVDTIPPESIEDGCLNKTERERF